MHELALSKAIVDAAVRHAENRPVSVVRVRVGTLRQAIPDSIRFHFEIVARGTLCEGRASSRSRWQRICGVPGAEANGIRRLRPLRAPST